MSWLQSPGLIGNSVAHQPFVAGTGVTGGWTGPSQTGSQPSFVVDSGLGELLLYGDQIGCVLTEIVMPRATINGFFAWPNVRIRLSDSHAIEFVTRPRVALRIVVGGSVEKVVLCPSLEPGAGVASANSFISIYLHAWYVSQADASLQLVAFVAPRAQLTPQTPQRSHAFGAGTAMIAQQVAASDAFHGGARIGFYFDEVFTPGTGGSFLVAAKHGWFDSVRHAVPDSFAALQARAGSGLASMRQDLANIAFTLPSNSAELGQGIVDIDNGGHPEYPAQRLNRWAYASRMYATGEVGFLPTGTSNVGDSDEINQRLAFLEFRVSGPTLNGSTAPGLDQRPLQVPVTGGFNDYGSYDTYAVSGENYAVRVTGAIYRQDAVLPSNATGFTGVSGTTTWRCRSNIEFGSALTGPTGFTGTVYSGRIQQGAVVLTDAQRESLGNGEVVGPFVLVGTLDGRLYIQAVGPTGASAP